MRRRNNRPRPPVKQKAELDVVDPLKMFDLEDSDDPVLEKDEPPVKEQRRPRERGHRPARPLVTPRQGKLQKAYFVTGTDTGIGKTIVTYVLGMLLKKEGRDVGVMKPVQCGGHDAAFLKRHLGINDPLEEINPFQASEPLSPHIAFQRQTIQFDKSKVETLLRKLQKEHDVLLVEGAGGLMVPLTETYTVADLVRDLDLELIIVARLGLGTINHTLLTIEQARAKGIRVKGVVFNQIAPAKHGIPEKTNPQVIGRTGRVPILGIIPFMENITQGWSNEKIHQVCGRKVHLRFLTEESLAVDRVPYQEWDKKYVWHPFTQMKDWEKEEPLVIREAKGATLIDTQGRTYLDGVSSLWVNIHGHRHPMIDQAVKQQLDRLAHSTLLGLANPPAAELAKMLVEIAPRGLEKVFYSDNGSTAVEAAVKMAYQYWQNNGRKDKLRIAHLQHAYHGDTLGSVSIGGIDLFHKKYQHLTFRTVPIEFPDFYRAPNGKSYPDYTEECLSRLEQFVKKSHSSLAALVVEPVVQGAAGMIVWPDGILKRMAAVCREHDVFLIADEVATGFGRTGKMFACEYDGVTPDFLCLAKGLTGGYLPLAATLTTKKVYDGFLFEYKDQKTFFHGHTYTGNPLGCAAAIASLKIFHREQTLKHLAPKINLLSEKLVPFTQLPHVGDVRQKGFMAGIELVRHKPSKAPYPWVDQMGVKVCREVRKLGVILRPLGNVIVLMPPLAITQDELGRLLDATYQAVVKVTEGQRPHHTPGV